MEDENEINNSAQVYDKKLDSKLANEANFDYLLKIINLTEYRLTMHNYEFESGNLGKTKAYTFITIEPFGYFKSKMWKGNKVLLGYVRYKIANTYFDVAFSNPASGHNSILVENINQTRSGGENCLSRVINDIYRNYCNLSHKNFLEDLYSGVDDSGISIAKWVKFDNILDKDTIVHTSQKLNDKLDKSENHFDIEIPLVIRYGVTPTENRVAGVGVVIIDIDKKALFKKELERQKKKDEELDKELAPLDKTIQDAEAEQKVLQKRLTDYSKSEKTELVVK